MAEYKLLKVTKRGGVLEVLLNRPEKRNAINREMKEEWSAALDQADDDPEIHVVTLMGIGPVFSAGGDMKAGAPGIVKDGFSSSRPRHEIPQLSRAWYCRKAIVAGVHGYSGPETFNLLGYCDFIIAAKGTKFSFEITRLGGDGGTMPIMSMQLPIRVLKKLYMMGGWFDADQALGWDFVQRVVAPDDLVAETNRWAAELCKIPIEQIRGAKDNLHRVYELMGLVNIMSVGNRTMGHDASRDREFFQMILQKGMKEALRFRDSQFDSDVAKV